MTSNRTLVSCLVAVMLACAGTASAQITLTASPTSLSFAVEPGGSPTAQILTVGATSPVNFTAAAAVVGGGTWLSVSPGSGQTPAYLFVLVTPGSLAAGTYTGAIVITALGVTNSPLSVPVTLTVGAVTPGQLAAAPTSLSFTYATGGTAPANQNVLITSTTASPVNFTAAVSTSTGGNWLNINTSSATTPATISVGVNPTGLNTGTYNGTVTLTPVSAIGGSLQVPVTLTVTGTPQLSASPSPLTFYYQTGTTAPAQQIVALTSGGTPVTFTAIPETTTGGNWLVVTPNFAVTPSDLTVGISSTVLAVLPVGTYNGKITVTAPQASNSPLVIPVTLYVSSNPFLKVSPTAVDFTMPPAGPLPATKSIQVDSTGAPLPYSVTATTTTPSGVNWLSVSVPGALTPSAVHLSVNSAALTLPPGTYNGTVTVAATTIGTPTVAVTVTLTVSGAAALSVSPPAMVFNYQVGRVPPAIKTVEVKSTSVPVGFTAQINPGTGGNWLQISATSGTTPATLSLGVNPAGLAVGTYQSTVSFTPAGGGAAVTLQVALNVSNTALMNVSPEALTFDFVLGAGEPKSKEVALSSTGDPLGFTVELATTSGGTNWMAAFPLNGTVPAYGTDPVKLTVFVWAASLPLGTYNGTITVKATGANTQVIPVKVTVTSGVSLAVAPTSLTFSQAMGGTPAPAQKLALTSTGASVNFSATATTGLAVSWLAVTPGAGSTPAELSVTVDATRVPQPGTYYGSITIVSPEAANSPINIPVTFTLGSPQTIAVSPATLQFSYQAGSSTPAAQKVTVTSTGGSLSFTATASATIGSGWLGVTPGSGTTPAELSVTVSPAALQPGTYTGTITVSSPSATNSPQLVQVTLTVTAAPQPQPSVFLVANAASYARGALAVGEIVYLEGANIGPPALTTLQVTGGRVSTLLAETRILFDDIAAPLIYVSSTKSSAVVPYALAGRATTRIQVEYKGTRSSSLEFRLADAAPGLFSLDASGQGPGAILNQDYSVNNPNNPAARGSVVMLYGTGEGQLTPPVADGSITPIVLPLPSPVLRVSVTIGGRPAPVYYAGPAPGFVAGVLQANVQVPADITPGSAVPVVITVGNVSSQAGLTLAVR